MTLEPYDSQKLDEFSLRVLDVACALREMAQNCRENALDKLPLHDKKALEWIAKLETWAREGSARLQTTMIKQRAVQRAAATTTARAKMSGSEPTDAA
jgi:hypothetical protein